MTPTSDRRFAPKLVAGLLMIFAGFALVLENSGLLSVSVWHLFVPVALILFGLAALWAKGPLHFGGHVLLFFGLGTLLNSLGFGHISDRWWPLGLIWGGVVVVLRTLNNSTPQTCQDAGSDTNE